jgi:hypothetical protein
MEEVEAPVEGSKGEMEVLAAAVVAAVGLVDQRLVAMEVLAAAVVVVD